MYTFDPFFKNSDMISAKRLKATIRIHSVFSFFSPVFLSAVILIINIGLVKFANELKDECEKDLARNLKCEMVYVKPSDL